jgi:hypothetical protein
MAAASALTAENAAMADTTAPIDAATRATLDKLADIAVPPPVPWLPQTWGWAALGVVLAVLVVWAGIRWRRRRKANRYRVEALAELTRLEAKLGDQTERAEALAAMLGLLKRVALAAWPRAEVASLSGAAWVKFLREHVPGARLPDAAARLLDDGEYRPRSAGATLDEARAVAGAVRAWIRGHRVSA